MRRTNVRLRRKNWLFLRRILRFILTKARFLQRSLKRLCTQTNQNQTRSTNHKRMPQGIFYLQTWRNCLNMVTSRNRYGPTLDLPMLTPSQWVLNCYKTLSIIDTSLRTAPLSRLWSFLLAATPHCLTSSRTSSTDAFQLCFRSEGAGHTTNEKTKSRCLCISCISRDLRISDFVHTHLSSSHYSV